MYIIFKSKNIIKDTLEINKINRKKIMTIAAVPKYVWGNSQGWKKYLFVGKKVKFSTNFPLCPYHIASLISFPMPKFPSKYHDFPASFPSCWFFPPMATAFAL